MIKSALLISLILLCSADFSGKEKWELLFNGKDLSNWDKWLSIPDSSYDVPGVKRSMNGRYESAMGLNNDPLHVFSVSLIDGTPCIHISGQGFGALTTKNEYGNFHLSLDYKWGDKKWAPRQNAKRDSGILYFCVGEHGAGSGAWMQSQECQVQEGDTGDYWSVAGAIADVRVETTALDGEEFLKYKRTGNVKTIGLDFDGVNWKMLRCIHSSMSEKPNSEWNHVDIYAFNGKSWHVVNGATVMVLENSRHLVDGIEKPLVKGKIQLQTEGAEIFYRNVKIRALSNVPAGL